MCYSLEISLFYDSTWIISFLMKNKIDNDYKYCTVIKFLIINNCSTFSALLEKLDLLKK